MNVVVVGASSGAGRAAAVAFARLGCSLIIAARNAPALTALATECRAAGAPGALPVPCDMSSPAQVEALAAAAGALGKVDVWVNAASVLTAGEVTEVPVETIQQTVLADAAGTALLSRAALSIFEQQGHGTLINVSSLLGLVPNPKVPVYCMSKFAIRGLTMALQEALPRRSPIRVCLVLFGPLDTPIFTRAANYTGRRLRAIPPAASAERAAATIVRCARRPRRMTTLGATGWGLLAANRVAPGLTARVVARVSATLLLTGDEAANTDGAALAPMTELPATSGGGFRRVGWRARAGDAVGRWSASRGRR